MFSDKSIPQNPKLVSLVKIIKLLKGKESIKFDFGSDLGFNQSGKKILGRYIPSERLIAIDHSLYVDTKRWNFTFAHELGHFVFHRNLKLNKGILSDDIEQSFEIFDKNSRTPLEWLEWQANSFASALLMPLKTVTVALKEFQSEQGIKRNLGKIVLNETQYSMKDFNKTISHLSNVYEVSKTVTKIRLNRLGLIDDTRNKTKRDSVRNLS